MPDDGDLGEFDDYDARQAHEVLGGGDLAESATTDDVPPVPPHPDADALPYRVGDPVLDCAQGRPMLVVDVPGQTVAEWSGDNDYDLASNYANGRFGVDPNERVYACVYLSHVKNEPNRAYTFPASRLRLIEAHHADGGRRVYDRVAVDVLRRLFVAAGKVDGSDPDEWEVLDALAEAAGFAFDDIQEAFELADAELRFGEVDDGD